jgi:hypothetical protein
MCGQACLTDTVAQADLVELFAVPAGVIKDAESPEHGWMDSRQA